MDNLRTLLEDLVEATVPPFREDLDAYDGMTQGEKRTYIVRAATRRISMAMQTMGGKVVKVAIGGKNSPKGATCRIDVTIPQGVDWGRDWMRKAIESTKGAPVVHYVAISALAGYKDPNLALEVSYSGTKLPDAKELRR